MAGSRFFPFHALGFQCNPFRALAPEEYAEIAVLPESVRAALAAGFVHLQLLGSAGRGKTTILRALADRFGRDGARTAYEYLPEGRRRFRTDPHSVELFCLDEAQRLTGWERRRLLRAASARGTRLLLGSHEDLSGLFRRHGMPLATLALGEASEPHLREVLERRLEHFALPGAAAARFEPEAVRWLSRRFGSDLRSMERFLYELFQELEGPVIITPERLADEDARLG